MSIWKKIRRALKGTPPPRLPDFFICGAARSGTTSMWEYLRQHPDIFMPTVFGWKEPSFYCDLYGVKDRAFYLSLFAEAGNKKMVGEASTPYLSFPESAGRIHAELPHARIIIILRNPIERAYSMYKWMCENGYEKIPTFAAALEAEDRERHGNESFMRNNGQYYWNFLYFRSGLYHDQVKRYLDAFGAGQVKIFLFEDMTHDPGRTVRETYEFLTVDPEFVPAIEIHNPTSHTSPLAPDLRRMLSERYAPEIASVSRLLDRDLVPLWR